MGNMKQINFISVFKHLSKQFNQSKLALCILFSALLMLAAATRAHSQTLKADYQFQGNLNSSVAGAPAMANLTGSSANSFQTDTIDGYTRQTVRFPQNNGLSVNTSGVIPSNAYTIVMLFRFDDVSGFRRVADFSNRTSDDGAYISNGRLEGENVNNVPFQANSYIQVVIVRETSGVVRAYRDGALRASFTDSLNTFAISSANVLRFFQDDGIEASAGNVARIRLYDAPMTAAQIQALDRAPIATAGAAADIAFVSQRDGGNEIYTMKADGSEQRRLTNNLSVDSNPDWSPDGSKIVFVSNRDGNDEIYVMNADGSGQTRLTTNTTNDGTPVWSPDGSKIAITGARDGNNEIYVMNADGSSQTRLTNNAASDTTPTWSPNGTQIAFLSNRDGDVEIFKINADGSNSIQLTSNTAGEGQPAWSPDNSKIAFWSQRDGNAEIYTMNPDGTNPTRLTNNPSDDFKPSWSADSTKLTFASTITTAEIYTMNANGTNQTRLTVNSAQDSLPDWRGQSDGTVTQCSVIPIAFGQTFNGNLNTGSCVINNRFTDTYTFSGNSGDQIAITMNSNRFKVLELINPAGAVIQTVSVTDYAGNVRIPNNQEYFSLPAAGTYTIRAGTDGESAGTDGSAYSISLYKAQSASSACAYSLSSLRTNVTSDGGAFFIDVITQDDCPPPATPNRFGQIYSISSFIGGRLTFSVNSNLGATERQDTITIAGQTHTIFQYAKVPPVNDLFGGAAPLFGTSSMADAPVTGYNTGATAEQSEPAHGGKPAAKSVWYRWTAPAEAGLYSFSTSGSSFDTVMAIYACPASGDCTLANIMPVGSNDDTTGFDKTSKVNFRATANTTYYIAVDGKNGATGTIQLSFQIYERLYRLYLQTYNGDQSPLIPDSVTASNGSRTVAATRISQGVYEFNLPADKTVYIVTINGPSGIVWSVNNFPLGTSFSALNEPTDGNAGEGEIIVANAQNAVPRKYVGYIRNINQQELDDKLSVKIGYSRGANPRAADTCTVNAQPKIIGSISYAQYECIIQPNTLHDIIPSREGKRFDSSVVSFPGFLQGNNAEFLTPGVRITASNAPTYNISGRVLEGGAGTTVNLTYLPLGNTQAITLQTTTVDQTGYYEFKNLPPGTYNLKASRTGFVFVQPADITLQTAGATIDIARRKLSR
jgi:Tol biopolymer transport system component